MADFPYIPRLRIVKKLGSGGVADVYLAVQEPLNREVAVKVLVPALFRDAQLPRRFLREAETAARLRHPHIVTIHDVGQAGETFYIVMEYLQENLRDRVRRGALEPREALEVLRQMAEALGYAHGRGFIHRDVKPENIMFREDGAAVLVDFGIVKAVGSETRLTATGFSVGTPHYMSPEQIRDKELDGRADIYSLGIVFYEMLTGKVPFEGQDTIAIAMKHVQEPVPRLAGGLQRYQQLLERMMAKDREQRVQSGAELVRLAQEYAGAGMAPAVKTEVRRRSDEAAESVKEAVRERGAERAPAPRVVAPRAAGAYRKPKSIIEREDELGWEESGKEEPERERDQKESGHTKRKGLIISLSIALVISLVGFILLISKGRGSLPDIQMVWVPGGEFQMGSTSSEADRDEKPVHTVSVDGFWMGKYEVMQGQWKAVMGSNPSHFKKGDSYPVENVSWEDAQEFIRRLNSRSGSAFRLPTEAEWEYACRAGTTQDRYGNLDDIAWYDNNSGRSTHPVGQKRPNSYGLYDMLGNVWEWCQDWYGYYSSSYVRNPTGPSAGSARVLRGGSWGSHARYGRAAFRTLNTPSFRALQSRFSPREDEMIFPFGFLPFYLLPLLFIFFFYFLNRNRKTHIYLSNYSRKQLGKKKDRSVKSYLRVMLLRNSSSSLDFSGAVFEAPALSGGRPEGPRPPAVYKGKVQNKCEKALKINLWSFN